MSQFCTKCGAPVAGASFCPACGAPTGPAAAPVAPAAAAPAPKGSPVIKLLLIFVGIVVLIGAVGIASVVYFGFKVKNRVEEKAREQGIDLGALASSSRHSGRLPDPCSLLSKQEATDILGVRVISAESTGRTCRYGAEAVSEEEQKDKMAKALEKLKENSTSAQQSPEAGMKQAEEIAKVFTSGAGGGGGGFTVEISDDGKQKIAAMKIAMATLGAGRTPDGVKLTRNLSGIGDDAVLGPLASTLIFAKSGIGVEIDWRSMPGGEEKLTALAKQIASRL